MHSFLFRFTFDIEANAKWNSRRFRALPSRPIQYWEALMGRYLLLWLLGIPLPILLLIWVIGGLH